jgi:carboxyl-terminal processing protease
MEQEQKRDILKEARNITNSPEDFKKSRKLLFRYLLFFLFIFALIGSSFAIGYREGKSKQNTGAENFISIDRTIIENKFPADGKSIDFSLFWKVWDLLKDKYVDKSNLNAQNLVYGAIRGMLKATGDPYTTFFDPEETKSFAEDISGSFEGIGAELGVKDEILTIIAPLENSPAEKAGLRSGDKIMKIGDKTTSDMTVYEAVDLIRGPKGTEIKLTIFRQGDKNTKEIAITRDTIEVKSVKLEFKENNIAYLKINKFGENTDKEFSQAMNEIILKGAKGLVLDLRNNPGGLLDRAMFIASHMIPKGKVVVIEEDSLGKKNNLNTVGGDKLSQIPTVVLINEGSASAAEILAGALRDDQGIKLIGKKTFGKGSVQELISLPGSSSTKITIAKWLTPNGDYIMEKGINPDVEIELSVDDFSKNKDPQMDKAMEVIREEIKARLNN